MGQAFSRCVAAFAVASLIAPAPVHAQGAGAVPVPGLDHVPIAVRDLEAAAARYRALGFALKPGRPHANGLRNQHVKFADGTELELITAAEARDGLTAEYLAHLARGDGPAFLALFAPDAARVAGLLDAAGLAYARSGPLLTFPDSAALGYLFFGMRNRSPTDLPEHFQHGNGVDGLIGVWLAGDDLGAERALLTQVGAAFADGVVHVPDPVRATIASLPEGEVVLLPGSRQLVSGRRIVGATLRTRDLDLVRRALDAAGLPVPATTTSPRGSSLILPPSLTHGLWLEFRER